MSLCSKLSLVIPCYNEESALETTYQKINSLAQEWLNKKIIKDFELIFVDDGSKDKTLTILKNLTEQNKHLRFISLSKNFGHQAALTAGLYRASGEAIVSLDADLQDPPEVIPELLEKFAQGFEIVLGARNRRATDSFFKRATAHLFYQLMRLMGANVVPDHADFRLISKQVLRELKKFPESNRFLRGLIPSLGFKQTVVYYARARRIAGQTKYPLSKMISFALEGITSFTYLPLRLASIIGSCLAVGSLILASWAVLTKLLGKSIPGWASTVLPMYFLGGVQLLFLGIIGEYVGKIYIETKRRPFFIVKEESFEQSDR